MQETLFIINPVSDRGTTLKTWPTARRDLAAAGIPFQERFTTHAGEAIAIAREAILAGVRRVVAVGGDGTLNEVVNGYLDETGQAINPEASIGLLPSGTGSDFRRSLGWQTRADATRALIRAQTRKIDAMRVTYRDGENRAASRFAINVVSFGLGGEVVQYVNGWRERWPGWVGGRARFIAAAICALGQYRGKPIKIRVDDVQEIRIESNLIIAANGRFAGSGMMVAPYAELDDGLMNIILTDRATRLDIVRELPRIFQGAHLKNPRVAERKARSMIITTDDSLAADIDGEAAGYAPAQIGILPASVRFIS